ncbi:hypothetical protein [Paracoccus aestuariivivens]|uniref:Uncharacterized protein n=1 Tax=Paracoccus aestuariivivens TaxID=1820333 RepID=A0A6L6J8P6_9RHOB|nr:hypothetical protein [Paracoccus aestuariivivens]MTH77017.1 hypothetical protein [Paracoccus aestuariivivens]
MHVIEHVIKRLPDHADSIRRLYLHDRRFQAICRDMALAVETLKRFEARPDAVYRPEIDEYRHLLPELDNELREYLLEHRHDYKVD